jgi:hypothetical protein
MNPDRAERWRMVTIAGLVFLLAFGVYGIVAPPRFDGYEGETAAVAEGIARGQGALMPLDTELAPVDPEDRTGRSGILQPVLMVPFYAAGSVADSIASDGEDYTYRAFLLRLYSAFVTALCAAVLFLLVRVLGQTERWALATALLFAFASIALPYAGSGMEPTGTLMVMLAFLAAAWAARSESAWPLALVGITIGLAASTRPSNVVPAFAALVLLWPRLRSAEAAGGRNEWWRLVAALALPLMLGGAAFLAYNVDRFGAPFATGYGFIDYRLSEMPSAAVGLFLSPGKGLAWYSPLAILGALGLVTLWRRERTLAIAIIAGLALGAMPYLADLWSDETWGPRYLVGVAWLLLVPIAWWATTRKRRLILAAVAVVAVSVQLAGTLVNYRTHLSALVSGYTGTKVHGYVVGVPEQDIPYGDDPVRWIPELSPLAFHGEALVAIGARQVGLPEPEAAYSPFHGHDGSTSLTYAAVDVWWNPGTYLGSDPPRPSALCLVPFGLFAVGSVLGLWALGAGRRVEPAPPEPRAT